jgi:hypothetical protein
LLALAAQIILNITINTNPPSSLTVIAQWASELQYQDSGVVTWRSYKR